MTHKILISLIVIGLFLIVGCTQEVLYDNMEPPKKTLHFTLANEGSLDKNVKVVLNGKIIYDDELKSGFGTAKKVDSETTAGVISFEVTDLTTSKKELTTINTEQGMYVAVSFWKDSITIDQFIEEPVRFD